MAAESAPSRTVTSTPFQLWQAASRLARSCLTSRACSPRGLETTTRTRRTDSRRMGAAGRGTSR